MEITDFTWILDRASDRTTYLLALTFLTGFVLWLITRLAQWAFRKFPPGPKGLPFIGDVIHIPDQDWLASPQRRDDYGDTPYLPCLIMHANVPFSQRVGVDLLEKRPNIFSSRPHYISAGDFMTKNLSLTMPYGDQIAKAIMLALALMANPPTLEKHFHRHASSIMLSVNYHLPPVESQHDPGVVRVHTHVRCLLYWSTDEMDNVCQRQANRIDQPSFGATIISTQSSHGFSEVKQAWHVGSMLAGGGETTSTLLHWWLLAMLVYPAAQARAQAELDEVVGRARPPIFADVPSLPYIRAMVKETPRCSPIVPFGVPHSSTVDDWYEGMFIPKGTVCLQNMR
ncbi:cytochrome P450 [Lactarius psammicola]|nr:cytochrome P450 [Lactarius psammicola]